jgi:hypothetical protein
MDFLRPPVSPDDKRRARLLPEQMRVHVGITICEKSSIEAAMAMAATKCQEVAAFHTAILLSVEVACF